MTEWLILRLPRTAAGAPSWLPADATGRPLAPPQGGLPEAAALAGRRLAVVVPGADVLCTEVELPRNAGARAAQLVPFALEEQLIRDIDTQHFALGRTPPGARTPVAVVDRGRMDDWLAQLAQSGLQPELLCADAALLPEVAGYDVVLLEDETLSVRTAGGAVLTLSAPPGGFAEALGLALGLAPGLAPGTAGSAAQVLLHTTPLEWQRRQVEIEATRPQLGSLKVQLLGSGVLPWLAPQLPAPTLINLLQGAYARRTSLSAGWQRWRVAASLAAALLLLHLGAQGWRLWQLQRTARELDTQIAQLVGPELATSADVRAAVAQRLLLAQAGSGRSGLLPAMQVLAQALGAVPGARVEALSFRDGAVQLKLRAGDAQSLERINQSLRAAGWQSELVSGGAAGDAYEGNIQLRGGVT